MKKRLPEHPTRHITWPPAPACILGILLLFAFYSCAVKQNQVNAGTAEAHNKLGSLYLKNNQLNEAYVEFQKSVSLDPDNKEALNFLGYISARFNRNDEAVSYYMRAIEADPDYADAMNNLGVVYLELKEWDKAIKYFKDALSYPTYSTPEKAYLNLGTAYYKKGDYLNAENTLREALIRNPVFPLAMYTLGLVYAETGRYELAVEEFKKAVGILPGYIDAHWQLAKTYIQMGLKSKASKHFEVVAGEDENIERRRKALEYLERIKY